MGNNGKDFSMFTVRFKKKAVMRSVMQTLSCGKSRQKTLLWQNSALGGNRLEFGLLTRLVDTADYGLSSMG